MHDNAFQEAYTRLNKAQKEAVDTIEGPVMVIAGPGTGKTQILTLRIANILRQTDAQPEHILALTFTESGAKAMRERLASYIGAPAYRVGIHTFHEFAGTLIRRFPDAYSRAVSGRPITDLEKILLIESIIASPTIKLLRPTGSPEYYIKPIMGMISEMKREYVTPDALGAIIATQENNLALMPKVHEKGAHKGKVRKDYLEKEKDLKKNRELLHVYRAYESALASEGQFDFDDMIYETVDALEKNEDMLRTLQEEYQYVLADEHQDVNGSQNKILELLASYHDRPNLFVVGDEKQSIYRFQGASLENFLYFEEKFPHTRTIALTDNYRSTQNILDLAHELISVEAGPAAALRVPLTASGKDAGLIEERTYAHEALEHAWLGAHIRGLVDQGVHPEEIAVIVRTNHEVESFASLLRKEGLLVSASADGDILSHPLTGHIRTLIRAVTHVHDERALFEMMQSTYVGLPVADIIRIMKARTYSTPLASILGDTALLKELGVTAYERVEACMQVLADARERMLVDAPHRVLELLIRETGLLHHALVVDPHESARVIRRLYDEVEEMVRHTDAPTLAHIDTMLGTRVAHGLGLTAPYVRTGGHAVSVMTAHKSKGLEFEYVYIPHLTDNRWGGTRRSHTFKVPLTRRVQADAFSVSDDERKLLYVAITRAKKGLFMSRADTNAEGRAFLGTRLLEDVGTAHITPVAVSGDDAPDLVAPFRAERATPPLDVAYVLDVLRERGLSPTALNNYLHDPWNYFYRNVLRVPEVQAPSAQFGTVLHDALRSVCIYRREHGGELPSTTLLTTYIERELGKLPLTTEEYTRHHERALVALTSYLDAVAPAWPHETKEEYSIRVTLPTGIPEFPEVVLTGKLDRLDFDTDGRLLRVVDYKTGKPKTRGHIEGTTKDADGNYKRQLVFYVLMMQLSDDERLKTRDGLLSFVEEDTGGKIREELFTITDEEIALLKGDVIRVVGEIVSGDFLSAPPNPDTCTYAPLAVELQARMR